MGREREDPRQKAPHGHRLQGGMDGDGQPTEAALRELPWWRDLDLGAQTLPIWPRIPDGFVWCRNKIREEE